MGAHQCIREGDQFYPGDYIYSPSRVYFAVMEANGLFNIYRGESPDDPQKARVWSTNKTMPAGYRDPRLELRKGPFKNKLKNLQIFMTSPGGAEPDDDSGSVKQLWASGGSYDVTSPMEGWLGDDGMLTLRQNEHGVWKDVWNNGFSDPIVSFEGEKMNYDFAKAIITANKPKTSARLGGENKTSHQQEVTLAIGFTESVSISFKTSTSLKIGARTTLKTGIPGIFEGKVELSTEVTQGFEWNKTTVNTVTRTVTTKVTVPPCQSIEAWVAWTESTFTVPYTCQGIGIFASGARTPVNVTGIYDGITGQKALATWDDGPPVCDTPADPSWLEASERTVPVELHRISQSVT